MWSIVLDVAVAAILIFSVVRGYNLGFFKTLSGIVVFILAIYGAGFIAQLATPFVSTQLQPLIETSIRDSVGNAGPQASLNDISVAGVRLGDYDFYNHAVQSAGEGVDSAIVAVSARLAEGVAYWVCAIFGFILLCILLGLAARGLNMIFRLPVLNFMNKTLGVIAGAIFGLIAAFLFTQIVGFFSGIVPPEAQQEAYIYKCVQSLKLPTVRADDFIK